MNTIHRDHVDSIGKEKLRRLLDQGIGKVDEFGYFVPFTAAERKARRQARRKYVHHMMYWAFRKTPGGKRFTFSS